MPNDARALAHSLEALFPGLPPLSSLTLTARGFSSTVIETGTGLILRIGRRPGAYERFQSEASLLPALQPRLSVQVPQPRWLAPPSPTFPHGVSGYQRIPGRTLTPAIFNELDQRQLARDVARFLRELDNAPDLAVANQPRVNPTRIESALLPVLETRLNRHDLDSIEGTLRDLIAEEKGLLYPPVLVHGDLWYENLLVDDSGRLCGVLDWEEAGRGDRAQDLMAQRHLGEVFAKAVITAYRSAGGVVNEQDEKRIEFHWRLRPFYGAYYSLQLGDEEELTDAIAKIRQLLL